MDISLEGLTVVNTRPKHQAESLSDIIRKAGGAVVEFPVIEIAPLKGPHFLEAKFKKPPEADIAIFISANAVDAVMTIPDSIKPWLENVSIASVGQATALKLESYGLTVNIKAPEPFNSEALLSLPELEMLRGKKVLIFRGEGGREFLADTLRARGAEVEYIECYRRIIPSSDPASLYQCWDEGNKLIILVTSNEGLRNLTNMVDKEHKQNLLASTLVVVSNRAVNVASELGYEKIPGLAATASNEAIFEAIQHRYSLN